VEVAALHATGANGTPGATNLVVADLLPLLVLALAPMAQQALVNVEKIISSPGGHLFLCCRVLAELLERCRNWCPGAAGIIIVEEFY